jgi:uncharacterized protein
MRIAGKALRLSIFVGDGDTWNREPVWREVVRRAHAAGLAGASVFRGMEGYGTTYHIHSRHFFAPSRDLPVAVIIGLVTLDPVDMLIHVANAEPVP